MTCDTPCPLTTIKPTPLIQSETRLDKYLLRWFLLLMLVFRSLVIPAMASVMNLLSVGAALG